MNKKRWLLLLLLVAATAIYIQLFYKTYQLSSVPKSADQIITIDKKRIINTLLWNELTTPSEWNLKAVFSPAKKDSSWINMLRLPDYIFIFHSKDQPANIYYTLLEIAGEKDFSDGLLKYHFIQSNGYPNYQQYYATESGLMLLKSGNFVMAAIIHPDQIKYAFETAAELFEKKNYQDKVVIEKTIAAASHAAYWINQNDFLQQDAVFKANFNKEQVTISGTISPAKNVLFEETAFSSSDSNLAEIGFTKPKGPAWSILPEAVKKNISGTLDCNTDSVITGNTSLQLSLTGIQQKIDSAISYSYDDDFNKIEKVVVNDVLEPALQITIKGNSVQRLYNHWKSTSKLEASAAGDLLVLVPFVKSYVTTNSSSTLEITSYNFTSPAASTPLTCIAFCKLNFQKLPGEAKKLLPGYINAAINNLDKASLVVRSVNGQPAIEINIKKQQNGLPLFSF